MLCLSLREVAAACSYVCGSGSRSWAAGGVMQLRCCVAELWPFSLNEREAEDEAEGDVFARRALGSVVTHADDSTTVIQNSWGI